ncbi:MAG: alpha/beta fold hydrolase, partial [Nevskiales bacterium]
MTTQAQASLNNSTIVRPRYSFILGLIRACFGVIERLAPGIGARWAERLWFTRPRLPAAARRSGSGLPPGTGFDVDVDGHRVRGLSWGEGPNIYLVHGWGGWGLQLAAFVTPLLKAGYRVMVFDMPSHGASDPGRLGAGSSTLVEFADALQAVVRAQGPAHTLVAHSLGATAAALALRDGLRAEAAVFIAPMADPVHYTHGFAQVLGFGERIRSRLQRRIEHRVGLPMAYFNVPRMARDMRTPP